MLVFSRTAAPESISVRWFRRRPPTGKHSMINDCCCAFSSRSVGRRWMRTGRRWMHTEECTASSTTRRSGAAGDRHPPRDPRHWRWTLNRESRSKRQRSLSWSTWSFSCFIQRQQDGTSRCLHVVQIGRRPISIQLVPHEAAFHERQRFNRRLGMLDRVDVHREDHTWLILAVPELLDLAVRIELGRRGHLARQHLLLLRRERLDRLWV